MDVYKQGFLSVEIPWRNIGKAALYKSCTYVNNNSITSFGKGNKMTDVNDK